MSELDDLRHALNRCANLADAAIPTLDIVTTGGTPNTAALVGRLVGTLCALANGVKIAARDGLLDARAVDDGSVSVPKSAFDAQSERLQKLEQFAADVTDLQVQLFLALRGFGSGGKVRDALHCDFAQLNGDLLKLCKSIEEE